MQSGKLSEFVKPSALTLPSECQQVIEMTSIKSDVLDADSQNLIDFQQDRGDVATIALLILSVGTILSSPSTEPSSTTPIVPASNPTHLGLRECIKYFLGLSSNRLLFIDSVSWLSSAELNTGTTPGAEAEYTRHFLVPNEFVPRETGILLIPSPDKDAVFAVGGELAVVRNGLKVPECNEGGRGRAEMLYASSMDN
jgi:hypothetical protein